MTGTSGPERVGVEEMASYVAPVILTITDGDGTPLDGSVPLSARVVGADETAAGPDVPFVAILPEGAQATSFAAGVTFPSPGWWRLDLTAADGSRGSVDVEALDPGTTAPIGQPAPGIDTPTLYDVGGRALAITTQPAPDLRMSRTSTADARAAGKPMSSWSTRRGSSRGRTSSAGDARGPAVR